MPNQHYKDPQAESFSIRREIESNRDKLHPKQYAFLGHWLDLVMASDSQPITHAVAEIGGLSFVLVTDGWPSRSETYRTIADRIRALREGMKDINGTKAAKKADPEIDAFYEPPPESLPLFAKLPEAGGFVYAAARLADIPTLRVLDWLRSDADFGRMILSAIDRMDDGKTALSPAQELYVRNLRYVYGNIAEAAHNSRIDDSTATNWFNENLALQRAVIEVFIEVAEQGKPLTERQEKFLTTLEKNKGRVTATCEEMGFGSMKTPSEWAKHNPRFARAYREIVERYRSAPKPLTDTEQNFIAELDRTTGNQKAAAHNLGLSHAPVSNNPAFETAVKAKLQEIEKKIERGEIVREIKILPIQTSFLAAYDASGANKQSAEKEMGLERSRVNGWLADNPTFAGQFEKIKEKHAGKPQPPKPLTDTQRKFLDELDNTRGNQLAAAHNIGLKCAVESRNPAFQKALRSKLKGIESKIKSGEIAREMKILPIQERFLSELDQCGADKIKAQKNMRFERSRVNGWLQTNPTFAERFEEIRAKHASSKQTR